MESEGTTRVLNWNACSLRPKARELSAFLAQEGINVAVITETHLQPEVNVPDFRLVRLDRCDFERRGIAIALWSKINCILLPTFQLQVIEAIGVLVETSIGPIKIFAAYCPKQATINDGTSMALKQDLIKLTRRQGQFILAGDLNARHGETQQTRNGLILQQDVEEGHYNILSPGSPTRLNRIGAHSTIDVFLTNMDGNSSQPVVHQDLSSNHYPVVAEVGSLVNRNALVHLR